jgi:hypothetical protein
MMQKGMGIHGLLRLLKKNFTALGVEIAPDELERIAVIVSISMGAPTRRFHTLHHVAGFLRRADPEFVLAAVFHDLVYYSVDKTVPPALRVSLENRVSFLDGKIRIKKIGKGKSSYYTDLLGVFGFDAGRELTAPTGMNEFLSACAFLDQAGAKLPREAFLSVAACIEASIPFRPSEADSGAFHDLSGRLSSLGLPDGEVLAMVRRAVRFANEDVADFQHPDPAYFLNNTWKLLPEIHPHLLLLGAYTITDYRKALYGMEKFFQSLSPGRIFHRYADEPSETYYQECLDRCAGNLRIAGMYIQAKLLAAGCLEAIAALTGGDAPLVLFMGDAAAGETGVYRLEQHLPALPRAENPDDPVYRLLAVGRLSNSCFDIKNSPLALHLYVSLGRKGFVRSVEDVHGYFSGAMGPSDFLARLDRKILTAILKSCAVMVPTRADSIGALTF